MNSTKNGRTFPLILVLFLVLITAAEGLTTIYGTRARRGRNCVIPTGREYTGATIRRRYGYGRDLDPLLPGSSVTHNTEVVIVCETVGDMIMDYDTRTCRYGRWYKGFQNCKKNKTVPRPNATSNNQPRTHCTYRDDIPRARPNNTMVTNSRYPHGTTISYICNSGYRLMGDRERRCESGVWTPVKFRCVPSKTTTTTTKMPTTTTAATRTTKKKTQSGIRHPTSRRRKSCLIPIRRDYTGATIRRRYGYGRNLDPLLPGTWVTHNTEVVIVCEKVGDKIMDYHTRTCRYGRWYKGFPKCKTNQTVPIPMR